MLINILVLYTSSILLIFIILLRILRGVAYFQQKGYRWDRLKNFLWYENGLIEIVGYEWFLELYLLLLFLITWRFAITVHFYFFILITIVSSFHILRVGIRRPQMTKKVLYMISILILLNALILKTIGLLFFISFLLIFQWPLIMLIFLSLIPVNNMIRRKYLTAAAKKRTILKKVKIIGITGSYGKTTTKEFVAHILSTKYKTISTPKNINSDIGIANFFLKNVTDEYDFFVVEMGAYRQGEIRGVCEMLKPDIGILTGINSQHIGLFGSQEIITAAKFELFDSLSAGSLALANIDSPAVAKILKKKHLPLELIQYSLAGTSETVFANLLPALILGQHFGMTHEELFSCVSTLPMPLSCTRKWKTASGALVLENSFSSNVDGFLSALSLLERQQVKTKIIITPGIMELGRYMETEHDPIFKKLDEVGNKVVVTKNFLTRCVRRFPFQNLKPNDILISENKNTITKWLKPFLKNETAILIEGRVREDIIAGMDITL